MGVDAYLRGHHDTERLASLLQLGEDAGGLGPAPRSDDLIRCSTSNKAAGEGGEPQEPSSCGRTEHGMCVAVV